VRESDACACCTMRRGLTAVWCSFLEESLQSAVSRIVQHTPGYLCRIAPNLGLTSVTGGAAQHYRRQSWGFELSLERLRLKA
jgi:hypothetical protein